MSSETIFLSLNDILHIHEQEILLAGGEPSIRDLEGIKACVDSPKSSFGANICMIYSEWLPHILLVSQ